MTHLAQVFQVHSQPEGLVEPSELYQNIHILPRRAALARFKTINMIIMGQEDTTTSTRLVAGWRQCTSPEQNSSVPPGNSQIIQLDCRKLRRSLAPNQRIARVPAHAEQQTHGTRTVNQKSWSRTCQSRGEVQRKRTSLRNAGRPCGILPSTRGG